ncbi:copper transporter [Geosporobacter ferrireducens]|uniref:Copper transporter n=1 Tax=Geosporobacter ferrireducens TaxID=1424294 RepID=A0A1D8GB50_9FIRM|nr:copper transporter [Geosporobacter ferrireducens]AOT68139.1 hypothetical protein Gferi_00210 [Geosporobacter ferrireducens]
MVVNLKYYVLSFVAIFLALGVGIFIGVMLDGQEMIVEQQQQLVQQLESKFDEFKQKQDELQVKNDLLTVEREKNLKFIDTVYPEAIQDKLKDLDIVIIETSEDYAYSGLIDAFQKAGVNSVSNILIKNTILLNDDAFAQQIAADLKLKGKTAAEIEKQLLKEFHDALMKGNNFELIRYLKEKKIIDYSGNLTFPPDYVLIAGGSTESGKEILNRIDIPLITYSKNSNIPVIAVEKSNVQISGISDYKKLRISTVDNVDTFAGKISTLMVVSGRSGHFGEKDTAEAYMPEGFITID